MVNQSEILQSGSRVTQGSLTAHQRSLHIPAALVLDGIWRQAREHVECRKPRVSSSNQDSTLIGKGALTTATIVTIYTDYGPRR